MNRQEEIKKNVEDEIKWDSRINSNSVVNVEVKEDKIVLKGVVHSYVARQAAHFDAWLASGVPALENIENQIIVLYPKEKTLPSDEEIRIKIEDMLMWNSFIDSTHIKINVESGIVIVQGRINSYREKRRTIELITEIIGVVDIQDELIVDSNEQIIDETIENDVVKALERHPKIDINSLDVQVENGKVILSGIVPDLMSYMEAEDTAYLTRGVIEVENNLTVEQPESISME